MTRTNGKTAEPEARPDGFRPRKTRPDGWLEQAILDGSVADPDVGPEPHKDYRGWDNVHVVEAPLGEMGGGSPGDDYDDNDAREQGSQSRSRTRDEGQE